MDRWTAIGAIVAIAALGWGVLDRLATLERDTRRELLDLQAEQYQELMQIQALVRDRLRDYELQTLEIHHRMQLEARRLREFDRRICEETRRAFTVSAGVPPDWDCPAPPAAPADLPEVR